MKRRRKELFLSILGILALIAITTGVTFAFFSYTKEGTTENTITTGTITFLYTEVSGVGKGISVKDAYPVSDEVGKAQVGEGKVFDFKVTSTTPGSADISYEVTARKKTDSTLDESVVKLYLTKVSGSNEEEVLLANFDTLTQTSKVDSDSFVEKTLYTGKVPAKEKNYEQNFRLRMWIDTDTDFSPEQDENGNDVYPYNDKSFTVTVNVYANAKVVTSGEVEDEEIEEITPIALSSAISNKYTTIYENPTLTDSSNNTDDASGLYKSTATNSGDATYYFRGNVGNYLDFAGITWRIVRINEDGTIRLIMQDGIDDNTSYGYISEYKDGFSTGYYSNSDAKTLLENWYNANIANTDYASDVTTGSFCEQGKVSSASSDITFGSATLKSYTTYTPDFYCGTDANGYGKISNTKIGLLTYDELVYAGAYFNKTNNEYYLYNGNIAYTMSPVSNATSAVLATIYTNGSINSARAHDSATLRPVINILPSVMVTGTGDSNNHWVVQ